jgi:PKD repeat protein
VDEVSQGTSHIKPLTEITDTHSINTTGTPVPGQINVIFTISPQSGSVPLTVEFNDTSIGGPSSWYWQLGDGTSSPLQNLTHTYTIPGTYTVSLRAYNSQTGGYGVCNDCIQVNS